MEVILMVSPTRVKLATRSSTLRVECPSASSQGQHGPNRNVDNDNWRVFKVGFVYTFTNPLDLIDASFG